MNERVKAFRAMFEAVYQSVPRRTLHTLTSGELIEQARYLDRELLQKWTSQIINDFYVMMMNGRVHRTLVAAGFEQPSVLQNNLLSGEDGIESTEPTKMLLRMCAYIRQHSALRTLVETADNATIQIHDPVFHGQCLESVSYTHLTLPTSDLV